MATRTDILNGGIAPMAWNGTYGLVPVRKRVDIAAIIAESGAIATGDVFQLFTMPANFKPVQSTIVVIRPDTGSGSLTAALGAATYGLTTARDLKAAAATITAEAATAAEVEAVHGGRARVVLRVHKASRRISKTSCVAGRTS